MLYSIMPTKKDPCHSVHLGSCHKGSFVTLGFRMRGMFGVKRARGSPGEKRIWETGGEALTRSPLGYTWAPASLSGLLNYNTNHRAYVPATSFAQKVPPIGLTYLDSSCHLVLSSYITSARHS